MKKPLKDVLIILFAAAGLGILANAVNPRGVGWEIRSSPADTSSVAGPTDPRTPVDIDIETAYRLYENRQAVFIDTRPAVDFQAGHIPGALNGEEKHLDVWMPAFFEQTPTDALIVTYCSSRTCPLAHRLARQLTELGYTRVRVMAEGWQTWHSQGLPAVGGEA